MTTGIQVQQGTGGDRSVVVRIPAPWLRYARGPRRDLDQILGDNPRAVFACDGTMFEATAGTDVLLNYDAVLGVNVPSRKPDEGMTVAVVGGVAQAVYGGILPPGATVAVQTWPSLVRDGVAVPHDTPANRERVWRIGMGVDGHGYVVVVMLVGAMIDLSNRMVREGLRNAGYLDGGSSLAAAALGASPFRRTHTAPSGVRVPGWVLAVPPDGAPPASAPVPPRAAPAPAAPPTSSRAGAVVKTACVVTILGLFGWIVNSDS